MDLNKLRKQKCFSFIFCKFNQRLHFQQLVSFECYYETSLIENVIFWHNLKTTFTYISIIFNLESYFGKNISIFTYLKCLSGYFATVSFKRSILISVPCLCSYLIHWECSMLSEYIKHTVLFKHTLLLVEIHLIYRYIFIRVF